MKSMHIFHRTPALILFVFAGCSAPSTPDTSSSPAPALPPQQTAAVEKAPATAAQATAAKTSTTDADLLQGKWKGEEINGETPGVCRLTIAGNIIEFHGANSNEWYKIAITLHEDASPKLFTGDVKECPAPDFVGQSIGAIYKLENGALTIAGNAPGQAPPKTFDAPESRRFVFKKE
jgi:uncharacterized protein (TIGR03067 family)